MDNYNLYSYIKTRFFLIFTKLSSTYCIIYNIHYTVLIIFKFNGCGNLLLF